MLAETRAGFYRHQETELVNFSDMVPGLVFCTDVGGLLKHMGLAEYVAQEWRRFVDSSKRSLKHVVLHGSELASIPLGHSTKLYEDYEAIEFVPDKIQYGDLR